MNDRPSSGKWTGGFEVSGGQHQDEPGMIADTGDSGHVLFRQRLRNVVLAVAPDQKLGEPERQQRRRTRRARPLTSRPIRKVEAQ